MKVAIVNYSGNVGKTTVANHLLMPRMPGARLFNIESINASDVLDGVDAKSMRGAQFARLEEELMLLDDAVVDVGASNVEVFLERMMQTDGSHAEFDFFVVPVVKEAKQQTDTVATLRALNATGISGDRIRLLFNKVDLHDQAEEVFSALFGLARSTGSFRVDPRALVWDNEVFSRSAAIKRSVSDLIADETDYRSMVRSADSVAERDRLITLVSLRRLAVSANKNLDEAYSALFAA